MRIAMTFGALAAFGLTSPTLAADNADAPICTDRPTKANATCTVPAGKVQIETAPISWSLTELGDSRAELLTLGSNFVKVGLSDRSDLQVGFTPHARLTVKQGGVRDRISGFGDVVVRYKHRLTKDGAPVQAGVIAFVKLPTAADGLGNGKVEGGLAVPLSFAIGKVTTTLGPELDLLADADGRGHHVAVVNLINFAIGAGPGVTVVGELWSNFNFDPAGTVRQASADAALVYALSETVQLDLGVYAGLTRATADVEVYLGTSVRF